MAQVSQRRQPRQQMLHQMLGLDQDFEPYEFREYPKHIRKAPGDKDYEVVNSAEEEAAVRASWGQGKGVVTIGEAEEPTLKSTSLKPGG